MFKYNNNNQVLEPFHLLSLWHLIEIINEPFDQLGPDFQALINLCQILNHTFDFLNLRCSLRSRRMR
uniref:Uncharacterized protein n=1 Tax=Vitis vinifera TaxID=29760 RepID=F6HI97_VITVI